MTDCLNCSTMWSGDCKQCPGHLAELAAWKYKIDQHVHHMARVAWRLQPDRAILSETKTNMVSLQDTTFEPTHETQSRHALSYPIYFPGVSACKSAPREQIIKVTQCLGRKTSAPRERHEAFERISGCGEIPRGASFHRDTISTEKADELGGSAHG